MEVLSFGNI